MLVERILVLPPERACPRTQRCSQILWPTEFPSPPASRMLLRPGTGALRPTPPDGKSMMAAAAVTAPSAAHIFVRRHSAQFKGFIHVLMNRRLNILQFLLRIEEIASHRIVEDSFALLFKIVDFLPAERCGHLLLFLQRLAFIDEILVLGASLFVSHERVNPFTNGLHIRLVQDGLAQFFGFLEDGRFFDQCLHNV
jgi:hypothetical protein